MLDIREKNYQCTSSSFPVNMTPYNMIFAYTSFCHPQKDLYIHTGKPLDTKRRREESARILLSLVLCQNGNIKL